MSAETDGRQNMKHNCDYYMELISASIDGELDAEEERSLNEHLDNCEKCRKIKKEYEYISSLTAENAAMADAPETLLDGVMEYVRASGKYKKRHYGRYLGLAASLAVVIMGSFMFAQSRNAGTIRTAGAPAEAASVTTYLEAPAAAMPEMAYAAQSEAVCEEADTAIENPVISDVNLSRKDMMSLFEKDDTDSDMLFDYSAELITDGDESLYVYVAGDEVYCYSDDGELLHSDMSWTEFEKFVHINK